MKKLLMILAVAFSVTACNDAANTDGEKKDAIEDSADAMKDRVEDAADSTKQMIEDKSDAAKDSVDKVDSLIKN